MYRGYLRLYINSNAHLPCGLSVHLCISGVDVNASMSASPWAVPAQTTPHSQCAANDVIAAGGVI